MATVTIYNDFGAQEYKVCFHCFPIYLPWSDGTGCYDLSFWMLSFKPAFHSPLSLSSRGSLVLYFLPSDICISEVIEISPSSLISACTSSSLAFHMMYSACKLNKQGNNIQPWRTPFPIWNQSVAPCLVLTVASWPAYRFLRRQVRWSGIPISFNNLPVCCDPHSQKLWCSQ